MKIIRLVGSPYYVSPEILPIQFETYLPYASGAGYILSATSVDCLTRNSAKQPFLPSEDANTGWILSFYCQVQCTTVQPINWYFGPFQSEKYFLQHYVPPNLMKIYHNQLVNKSSSKSNFESLSTEKMDHGALRGRPESFVFTTSQAQSILSAHSSMLHRHESNMAARQIIDGKVEFLMSSQLGGMRAAKYYIHQSWLEEAKAYKGKLSILAIKETEKKFAKREALRQAFRGMPHAKIVFLMKESTAALKFEQMHYQDLYYVELLSAKPHGKVMESHLLMSFLHALIKHHNIAFRYVLRATTPKAFDMHQKLFSSIGSAKLVPPTDYVTTRCRTGNPIIRNPDNPWFLPHEQLPNQKYYPVYA